MEAQHDSLQILFIRHAETDYNDIGDRDPSDGELTAKGEQQCVDLGEKLKDLPINAYITSSLLRSFKTAVGVCNAKSDKPLLEICPELLNAAAHRDITAAARSIFRNIIKTQKCVRSFSAPKTTNSDVKHLRITLSVQKKLFLTLKTGFHTVTVLQFSATTDFLSILSPRLWELSRTYSDLLLKTFPSALLNSAVTEIQCFAVSTNNN